jgi:hypothetical protein
MPRQCLGTVDRTWIARDGHGVLASCCAAGITAIAGSLFVWFFWGAPTMSDLRFKGVFGESHLERRCRVLFAICLSSIIFTSVWWLEQLAEELVKGATIAGARKQADAGLVRCHWVDAWEEGSTFKELASELERDLRTQKNGFGPRAVICRGAGCGVRSPNWLSNPSRFGDNAG